MAPFDSLISKPVFKRRKAIYERKATKIRNVNLIPHLVQDLQRKEVNWARKRKEDNLSAPLVQDLKIKREAVKNWVGLPDCVTLDILMKLDTMVLLVTARHVCSHWRKLAKESILYRSVIVGSRNWFVNPSTGEVSPIKIWKLLRKAVSLSRGQMVEFSCGRMNSLGKSLLKHIAASSLCGLKSLRLGYTHVDEQANALFEVIKGIPTLEELYYSHAIILEGSIKDIGRSCPNLKYFWCHTIYTETDKQAFAIAKSMPGLRRLCLYGERLTDGGLQALLDGCPHLEYLYFLDCFCIDFEKADFWKTNSVHGRIKRKNILERTHLEECKSELNPTLHDEQSLSIILSSDGEEVGDSGL